MAEKQNINTEWILLEGARDVQQQYYELIADWTVYVPDQYQYLKQNIGYALFGAPSHEKSSEATDSKSKETDDLVQYKSGAMNKDVDITDAILYDPKAMEVINKIFEIVCKYGETTEKKKGIYFGTIYNVIFRNKNSKPTTDTKEILQQLCPIPVFKIRKYKNKDNFDPWFIDESGRVYKTWIGYLENNHLPECTMVFPKDGLYQPNPELCITEESSFVWVQSRDSPACKTRTKILSHVDKVVTAVGITAGIGLGVATFFTPVGPLILGLGAATSGASGLWTAGRSSYTLIDRASHEQTISLKDREALSAWIAIGGSAASLAMSGGSLLLSKAAERGSQIGTIAKVAYNSVLFTDISINFVGIGLQGYFLYEKYKEGRRVDLSDIFFLGTHILFFGNAVLNVKFAGEVISSSQGKILEEYQSSLKSKRHRKAFNRVKRKAATNNSSEISQNAEVIRYINKVKTRQELFQTTGATNVPDTASTPTSRSLNLKLHIDNGNIKINNVLLIDPKLFVLRLLKAGVFTDNRRSSVRQNINNDAMDVYYTLSGKLLEFLTNCYLSDYCPNIDNLPTVQDFDPLLHELKHVHNAEDMLKMIFKIGFNLLQRSNGAFDAFLIEVIQFLWNYMKANVRERIESIRNNEILYKIITTIYQGIDMIVQNLIDAFAQLVGEFHKGQLMGW